VGSEYQHDVKCQFSFLENRGTYRLKKKEGEKKVMK
jgi:hypothetical protein